MTLLILSFTWWWNGTFRGDFLVCVAIYLTIGLLSHRRRGESAREIGIRLDNVWPALRQALPFVVPMVGLTIGLGFMLGTLRPAGALSWASYAVEALVWTTLQQYGLLAFFHRRVGDVVDTAWPAILITAGFFALFHLPNPFLVPVTFGTGALSCWLYRRVPNVLVLGLMHAVVVMAITRSLPYEITFGMRVGPGFFGMLESLRNGW